MAAKLQLPRLAWPALRRKGTTASLRVGLDVGSSAIKVVLASAPRKGAVQLLKYLLEPLSDETNPVRQAALQRVLTTLGVKEGEVRMAIAGQDIVTRLLTLPQLSETELDSAIRFEGETHIPFPLDEVALDRQVLERLEGNKMRVLLVAGKKEAIQRRVALATTCGLKPVLLDVEALAVTNAYLADQETTPEAVTTALVHIGAHYTNVVILRQGQLCSFTRDLNFGGQDLTKTIAEQFNLPPAEAERLKCEPGERQQEVAAALQRGLEVLVGDLRLSFDFYETQLEDTVARVLVSGGTALLPQLPGFLQEQLGLPTTVWSPVRWLTQDGQSVPASLASRLAVCVGLVVRDLA